MGILELFLIIFAVILLVIIVKIVGKVVKFALTIFLVLFIIFGIGVFLASADYRTIKEEYPNSTNLFVFTKNSTLTHALKAEGFGLKDSSGLSKAELIELRRAYNVSDYESMLGSYYRLLLVEELGYNKTHSEIVKLLDDNNLKAVGHGVKDGYIEVYPKSAFFRALRYIPDWIISLKFFYS